ncbi:MAG: winged helix-turn-helix domain-containing protein [Thermoanaerobaculia bacterium]|nr:winged helix-turn-helix domain-containing protein [Thermoanaerobaculia bacterium]
MDAGPQDAFDRGARSPGIVELSGTKFDSATGDVDFGTTTTRLSPKIADLLLALVEAEGEVLTKDQLISRVWPDTIVSDDALWRSMSELRSAFEDGGVTSLVETLPRRGYRLLVPVSRLDSGQGTGGDLGSSHNGGSAEPTEAAVRPPKSSRWPVFAWGMIGLMTLLCLSVVGHRVLATDPSSGVERLPSASHTEEVMVRVLQLTEEALALRNSREVPGPDAGITPVAFDALVRSGSDDEDPAEALARLAHALHARGRLRTALDLYHSAMSAGADRSSRQDLAALAREAIVENRTALDGTGVGEGTVFSTAEDRLQMQVEKARRHRLDGSYARSLEALKAVLEADPGYRPALLELVRAHLALGDAQNARETLRRSLSAEPESVELLTMAAEAELILGEFEAGLDLLDQACLAWARSGRRDDVDKTEIPRPLLCWL